MKDSGPAHHHLPHGALILAVTVHAVSVVSVVNVASAVSVHLDEVDVVRAHPDVGAIVATTLRARMTDERGEIDMTTIGAAIVTTIVPAALRTATVTVI